MDAVPVLSQIKSLAQLISQDSNGALQTQINFVKMCPVVSQCTSVVQLVDGNTEGAKETQMIFLKGVNSMVDSVPVVGHTKAALHYMCGDNEGGSNAVKAATHTTGAIAGGMIGFFAGGPVGAAVGGALGGASIDTIISTQTNRQYGFIDKLRQIRDDPLDGGKYVDLAGGLIIDGMVGYTAGTQIGEKLQQTFGKRKLANADLIDAGESMEFPVKKKIKGKNTQEMIGPLSLGTGAMIGLGTGVGFRSLTGEATLPERNHPDC